MKIFNAIQVVLLFGAMPFIMTWLATEPIEYSTAAWYVAATLYAGLYAWITYMTWYHFTEDTRVHKCRIHKVFDLTCPSCERKN